MFSNKIARDYGIVFIEVFIYNLILFFFMTNVLAYFNHVSGYNCIEPQIADVVFSILLSFFSSLFLPITLEKPSSIILWFLYLFHIAPSIVVSTLMGSDYKLIIIIFVYFITLVRFIRKVKFNFVKFVHLPSNLFIIFLLLLGVIFVITYLIKFGFTFEVPNITDVYGVRAIYKETMNPFIGYLTIMSGFSLSPFFILSAIIVLTKNNVLGIILMTFAFYISSQIFANTGFKSVAFVPLVIGVAYFYFRYFEKSTKQILFVLSLGLILLMKFKDVSNLFEFIYYHTIRRVILVPGMNVNYFYQYITDTTGMIWSKNIPRLISLEFYGTDGSANAGFVGDAFTMYYVLGFFINALILWVICSSLDSLTTSYNKNIIKAIVIPVAYALSNSSTSTVIITYGFLLTFMLLLFSNNFIKKYI